MQHAEHIRLGISHFENLSQLPDLDIFSRSFSSDLVTELSKFRQFWLTTYNGEMAESASPLPDYMIKGNFRIDSDTVRINVQLYHMATQQMLWGNRFEGPLAEITDLQETLLIDVVGALQQEINADLLSKMRRREKVNFRAYEHWLHGMEALKRGSVEADLEARSHFEEAIAIQPDYALAFTGMSLSYFNEWSCQLWDRWEVAKSGAYDWAQKAIELDDRNYIAAIVIGKIFLYSGAYETAEYYFRQSLALNPNDPETVIQIACYFVYLGLTHEAEELYARAVRLNPWGTGKYQFYGGFIYFEKGEYEKAAAMANPLNSGKWADAEVYFAGTHFYLKQYELMNASWQRFLENYARLIAKGKPFSLNEVTNWIRKINPHKFGKSNLEGFLQFIEKGETEITTPRKKQAAYISLHNHAFLKDGSTWRMEYEGMEVVMPEVKGFYDIAKLLEIPGKLYHCAELMGSVIDTKGEMVFDHKAKEQYEQRLLTLQKLMKQAEFQQDFYTLEKLQDEYDQLIEHLSKALGLKGKVREAGNPVEKARSAVTWRIRHAIARIEGMHPLLGAHLSNAIKTGIFCTYQPDRELDWTVIS